MWRKKNKGYIPGVTSGMSTGSTTRTRLFGMLRRRKSKTPETWEETLESMVQASSSQMSKLEPKEGSGLEPRLPDSGTSALTPPTTPYPASFPVGTNSIQEFEVYSADSTRSLKISGTRERIWGQKADDQQALILSLITVWLWTRPLLSCPALSCVHWVGWINPVGCFSRSGPFQGWDGVSEK